MDYLLDTHTFLWFINADNKLSSKARNIIENTENAKFISIASFWEIAIKIKIGSLQIKMPFEELKKHVTDNGFNILPITFENTASICNLPNHHKDPFNRIIIVQAIDEKMNIISKDNNFRNYNVKVIWD